MPTALVHLMVERFEKVVTPELRQAAADRGVTVRQLVTLASIVEKETAQPAERPEVAAVYSQPAQESGWPCSAIPR